MRSDAIQRSIKNVVSTEILSIIARVHIGGERNRRLRSAAPVVGTGESLHEQAHDFVADELVDEPVVLDDRMRGGLVEPVEAARDMAKMTIAA